MEFLKSHTQLSKFFLPAFQRVSFSAAVDQDSDTACAMRRPALCMQPGQGQEWSPKHVDVKGWNYPHATMFAEVGP